MFRLGFAMTIFYLFLLSQIFMKSYFDGPYFLSIKKYFFDINNSTIIDNEVIKNISLI